MTGPKFGRLFTDVMIVGDVLTTSKVVLGPAAGAVLPAKSEAVPAAMEMPSDPLPEILEMWTVLPRLGPVTLDIVPVAVPVVIRVISVGARVIGPTSAPPSGSPYRTTYVTGPAEVELTDGEPMERVGEVVSCLAVGVEAAVLVLPAASVAVTEGVIVPSTRAPGAANVPSSVIS